MGPRHILAEGIKNGKKALDPHGAKGAMKYTTTIVRNGKNYTLDVIYRKSDKTILHFHYH